MPWSQTEAIDACVAAFMNVPASIHLGPQRVLDQVQQSQRLAHRDDRQPASGAAAA